MSDDHSHEEDTPLLQLLEEFNEHWWERLATHSDHYLDNIVSKYTDKYADIRIDISIEPTWSNGIAPEGDQTDQDIFFIHLNLRLKDDETDELVSVDAAGISNEYMWEELSDAVSEDINFWAENGYKTEEFPELVKQSLLDDEPYSFYGVIVTWNDDQVVY